MLYASLFGNSNHGPSFPRSLRLQAPLLRMRVGVGRTYYGPCVCALPRFPRTWPKSSATPLLPVRPWHPPFGWSEGSRLPSPVGPDRGHGPSAPLPKWLLPKDQVDLATVAPSTLDQALRIGQCASAQFSALCLGSAQKGLMASSHRATPPSPLAPPMAGDDTEGEEEEEEKEERRKKKEEEEASNKHLV